jgi:hypothetical protein
VTSGKIRPPQYQEVVVKITSERLKIAISLLAVLFFVINAWQTKSVSDIGWVCLCVVWAWPERETKATPRD